MSHLPADSHRRLERGATLLSAPSGEPAAVVYPPDGTVSPFTVINLGSGKVQMGDSIHDGRLPALWFGKNGKGMGHEEDLNRAAHEGETLAVVTFANVEGLDVLAEVVQRIRRVSFPGAPTAPAPLPADTLSQQLQQRCVDWGVYWRASDAHGVDLSHEQALELLRDALGVEVAIAAPLMANGLVLQVPEGHVLLLFSRSGHGFNFDVRLANCVGVIDSDYRGELMVRLTNDRDKRLRIDFGDRIAQAMLVALPAVELVEVSAVGRTVRGAGGFGSTGA